MDVLITTHSVVVNRNPPLNLKFVVSENYLRIENVLGCFGYVCVRRLCGRIEIHSECFW